MLRSIVKTKKPQSLEIYHEVTIRNDREHVFEALTKSSIVDEWGGGPSSIQAKIYGDISFWDGDIYGTICEYEKPNRLTYSIRNTYWEGKSQDTLVEWRLEENPKGTLLTLRNMSLPTRKILESQEEFWRSSFLGPLKAYLERHLLKTKKHRR